MRYPRRQVSGRRVPPAQLLVIPALILGGAVGYLAKDPRVAQPLMDNASGQGSSCDIKGNINKRGEHIYHLPTDEYYSRTVIDEGRGERWFCSEEEARSAGWRHAKV